MPLLRPDLDEFIRECDNWCNVAGLARSTLSKHLMGRGGTLGEIARGDRNLTRENVARKRRWLANNPPDRFREKVPIGRPRIHPKPKDK